MYVHMSYVLIKEPTYLLTYLSVGRFKILNRSSYSIVTIRAETQKLVVSVGTKEKNHG